MCTSANSGDMGPLAGEALCASQLLAPCPTLNTLCTVNPNLPCIADAPCADICYPRPTSFTLSMPPAQKTMGNPCGGVPSNAFCSASGAATGDAVFTALPLAGGGLLASGWAYAVRRRRT